MLWSVLLGVELGVVVELPCMVLLEEEDEELGAVVLLAPAAFWSAGVVLEPAELEGVVLELLGLTPEAAAPL